MDIRATTPLGHCPSTASLPVRANIARLPDEADAKKTLAELEETTRMSSHHVDEDYPAGPGII